MSKLRLSLACWNYDRTRGLMDGSVEPDGIDLNYLNLPVEETFFRMGSEFQREINKTTGLDQITDLRRSITEPLKQTATQIRDEFNKPLAGGGVAPSGAIKPKDPKVESVVDEIHEKVGMPLRQIASWLE